MAPCRLSNTTNRTTTGEAMKSREARIQAEAERVQVRLISEKDVDDPDHAASADALRRAEAQRIVDAKDEAKQLGAELMACHTASALFGKSPEAVREAMRTGKIATRDLGITERDVEAFVYLGSAIEYWGPPDECLLDTMRANGLTEAVEGSGVVYNILHATPLASLRDTAAPQDKS